MAKVRQTRGKRRVKKNIAKGVAHVHSTFNNTIVTITDKVLVNLLHLQHKWLQKLLLKHQWIMV